MTESGFVECMALGFALTAFVAAPRGARRWYARLLRRLGNLGRRPTLFCAGLGLLSAVLAAADARLVHWPEPSVHDEFAYLLGAETFAAGQLTAPTHDLWEHFETFHVLQTPSHAPKYPPGQSLVLAAGMAMTGEVRAGLWLSAGAMAAALAWMLFGWMPARWAVLGSLCLALQLAVVGPWVQTFYGGAVAATGGALLLGAVPRLRRAPSPAAGAALGAGLGLLALTRPFEGLLASLPAGFALAWYVASRGSAWRGAALRRSALPAGALVLAAAAFIGLHNRAVTGSALRLPYVEYDAQYSVYPPFLWSRPQEPPHHRHEEIERFSRTYQAGDRHRVSGPWDALRLGLARQGELLGSLLGLILIVPLAGLVRRSATSGLGLPITVWAAVGLGLSTTVFCAPHYAAPAVGALGILMSAGWRGLHRGTRARGGALSLALILGLVAVTLVEAADPVGPWSRSFGRTAARITGTLTDSPGKDLVIVTPQPGGSFHHAFVYNAVDIDSAPIVWARDMGPAGNRDLLEHFADRRLWRLLKGELESGGIVLVPLAPDGAVEGVAQEHSRDKSED